MFVTDNFLLICDKLKFIYSEEATNFCKIFPLLLTVCTVVKSKGKISQNFVAFSEYMNFTFFDKFTAAESGCVKKGGTFFFVITD